MASELPPTSRHLMHVLCSRMDGQVNLILPRWQPSLTDLARGTGRDRRTVTRHLAHLEGHGWLIRVRPAIEDARRKHTRTQYTPLIPEGSYPQRPAAARARGSMPIELGASRPAARGSMPLKSSIESSTSGAVAPQIPNIKDMCAVCGRTGHATQECPERNET